jgi:hypothetical protein
VSQLLQQGHRQHPCCYSVSELIQDNSLVLLLRLLLLLPLPPQGLILLGISPGFLLLWLSAMDRREHKCAAACLLSAAAAGVCFAAATAT